MSEQKVSSDAMPVFRAGDTVAMIGDSITASALWWLEVREQWMVRNPGLFCDFRNLGIPGGGVHAAMDRYPWEIAPTRPTVALVMFGMNDVWREGYGQPATEDVIKARTWALEQFREGLENLVDQLMRDSVRVVLLTPTPFDEYASLRDCPNLPGVNGALAVCAGMVRDLAERRVLPVVDFHAPMTQRCRAGEELVSGDRVHPSEAGHKVMAELVLETFLPGPMADVPEELCQVSRDLHEAEFTLRALAMLRCRAQKLYGRPDDEFVRRFLREREGKEPNPWVVQQMGNCPEWLENQQTLERNVENLRTRLNHI